jgi:hypothetical protein
MRKYIFNILMSLDQLANTIIFGGMPDETISAKCWREDDKPCWHALRIIADTVALRLFRVKHHCKGAYIAELILSYMPECCRKGLKKLPDFQNMR